MKLRIGARGSSLSMAQTKAVGDEIKTILNIDVEYKWIRTKGDIFRNTELKKIGGKGLFTKELEDALLANEIDIAIHSAKDLPTDIPETFKVSSVLKREDPRDVLIIGKNPDYNESDGVKVLQSLKAGTVIGTGSARRVSQILKINKKLKTKHIRGNIDTRIKKLLNNEYDAVVLAGAGIKRLNTDLLKNSDLDMFYMDFEHFVPAAAQGILAVEYMHDEVFEKIKSLVDADTQYAFETERNFLASKGSDCNMPIGVYVFYRDGKWESRFYEESYI